MNWKASVSYRFKGLEGFEVCEERTDDYRISASSPEGVMGFVLDLFRDGDVEVTEVRIERT